MDPEPIISQTTRDNVILKQIDYDNRNNLTKPIHTKALMPQVTVSTKHNQIDNMKISHYSSNLATLNNSLTKAQDENIEAHTIGLKRQRDNNTFLNQILCCFRLSQPCNFHQSPSYVRQSNCLFKEKYSPKYLLTTTEKRPDKICMVIDLDETLVHSSFKPINNADFIVPVEIEGSIHKVYVLKRPYVDEFLERMGKLYECILFTASLSKYADPVTDLLDKNNVFRARLFRESCSYYRGNYVKDLSRLGRNLQRVLILDNSPASYIFHPGNAVPITSWFDDMSDTELLDMIPFFERLSKLDSIQPVLGGNKEKRPYQQERQQSKQLQPLLSTS